MADDTPQGEPATGDPEPTPSPELGEAGKKALEAERKARRDAEKAKADLEKRLREFEDRDKTDAERAAEALKAAERRADEAEARALRLQVAADKGLTPAQAKRLVGTTQEELEADADEILEAFPASTSTPPPSQRPVADLKGGNDPTGPDEVDIREVVDSIPRGA